MRLRNDAALNRLVDLMFSNGDKDANTVIEMWRSELEESARVHEETVRAVNEASPIAYGVWEMGEAIDVDGAGYSKRYIPVQSIRLIEQDVRDFCKLNKLDEKAFRDMLAGNRLEVGKFRSFDGRGLSSRQYIDKTELIKQREEDRLEDEKEAIAKSQRDELSRHLASPVPMQPTPWKGR